MGILSFLFLVKKRGVVGLGSGKCEGSGKNLVDLPS